MNLLQKKKMKSNFKQMLSVNNDFIDFLEIMENEANLDDVFKPNLELLKAHLFNMNVVFNQMIESVNKK